MKITDYGVWLKIVFQDLDKPHLWMLPERFCDFKELHKIQTVTKWYAGLHPLSEIWVTNDPEAFTLAKTIVGNPNKFILEQLDLGSCVCFLKK